MPPESAPGPHTLLVHQLFVSAGQAGGTRHLELTRGMSADGQRVTVIAGRANYLTGHRPEPDRDLPDGVEVRRVWSPLGKGRGLLVRVAGFFAFMVTSLFAGLGTRRVDLVWGTSPPLFQAATARALAWLKRVPFVLEVRDLWPDFAIELGVLRSRTLIAASRALEGWVVRGADQVVVNSPGFVPFIERHGVPADRIAVVPNGVDAAAFVDGDGEAFRQVYGLAVDDFVVLYAGAHGDPNGLEFALDAAERLERARPDLGERIRWVFVGDGRAKARLRRDALERDLGCVSFVGAQPKEAMPHVLAAADLCLAVLKPLPLFKTTFPNKVFDYMAAGRPVALAIDGVIREVVETAGAGTFVSPADPGALAEVVLAYEGDPARRDREGRAGRDYVSREFDRSRHAAQMAAIVRELAASRAR